jgi:hypothetical protein
MCHTYFYPSTTQMIRLVCALPSVFLTSFECQRNVNLAHFRLVAFGRVGHALPDFGLVASFSKRGAGLPACFKMLDGLDSSRKCEQVPAALPARNHGGEGARQAQDTGQGAGQAFGFTRAGTGQAYRAWRASASFVAARPIA